MNWCRGWAALPAAALMATSAIAGEVTGEFRLLVVPVNYTDDSSEVHARAWLEDAVFAAEQAESVRNWYTEASYGRMTLTGSVLDWSTLPVATAQCAEYTDVQQQDRMQALVDWLDPSVDFSTVDGMAVVAPLCATICSTCGNLDPQSFSTDEGQVQLHLFRMTGAEGESVRTFAATATHEMGHSFGLLHAHALDCGPVSMGSIGDGCTSVRAMGFDAMDLSGIRGHFNAHYKNYLGWFAEGDVVEFDPVTPGQELQVSLAPMAAAGPGPRVVRIPNMTYTGVAGSVVPHLAVEYRQAVNFDDRTGGFFPDPNTGVVISLGPEASFPWPQVHLVDTDPDSVPGEETRPEFEDAALSVGEWFYDPATGVGIGFTDVVGGRAIVTLTTPLPDSILADGFETAAP